MTQDEYLDNLQKKYERYFDVERNITLFGKTLDIHAKFLSIRGRTFLTKNDVIDRCENYEYCYVKKYDTVTEDDAAAFGRFLNTVVAECIRPGKDHMSTFVTGVIVGSKVEDNAKAFIKKYSCSRAYLFYLKGWCDVRLVCIDLGTNEITTNKAGKRVKKVYQLTP